MTAATTSVIPGGAVDTAGRPGDGRDRHLVLPAVTIHTKGSA